MMNKSFKPHKSSLGLDGNIVMLLAYFGSILLCFIPFLNSISWIVPLVIFLLEKDSDYVRFHAVQALFLEILGVIISVVLGLIIAILATFAIFNSSVSAITIAGFTTIITLATPTIMFIFSIVAAVKGWTYECYKIPIIGDIAEKFTIK